MIKKIPWDDIERKLVGRQNNSRKMTIWLWKLRNTSTGNSAVLQLSSWWYWHSPRSWSLTVFIPQWSWEFLILCGLVYYSRLPWFFLHSLAPVYIRQNRKSQTYEHLVTSFGQPVSGIVNNTFIPLQEEKSGEPEQDEVDQWQAGGWVSFWSSPALKGGLAAINSFCIWFWKSS